MTEDITHRQFPVMNVDLSSSGKKISIMLLIQASIKFQNPGIFLQPHAKRHIYDAMQPCSIMPRKYCGAEAS